MLHVGLAYYILLNCAKRLFLVSLINPTRILINKTQVRKTGKETFQIRKTEFCTHCTVKVSTL